MMTEERRQQFFERMARLLGKEEAEQLMAALGEPAPKAVRYNRQLCSPDELPGEAVPWNAPFGRYWQEESLPAQTLAYAAGKYYIQEASAMLALAAASRVIDFTEKIVLDLCAAPGGKATQAAELIPGGYLVANEIIAKRVRALVWNVNRLRLANVIVTSLSGDSLARTLPGFFDVVIVDAPCSGEGLFQKQKHSLARWSEKSVLSCARRQTLILRDAITLLRPGGFLVYSTCTFAREENEDQVGFLLGQGFSPLPLPADLPVSPAITENEDIRTCSRRIFPHRQRGAGAFVAILQKEHAPVGSAGDLQVKYVRAVPNDQAARSLPAFIQADLPGSFFFEKRGILSRFCRDRLPGFLFENSIQVGAPLIDKYRGSRVMFGAVQSAAAGSAIDLDEHQAAAYIRGEDLQLPLPDGSHFVAFQGMILGPIKITRGRAENHFPRPLRRKN